MFKFKKDLSVADLSVAYQAKQAKLRDTFLSALYDFITVRNKKVEAFKEAIKIAEEEKTINETEIAEAKKALKIGAPVINK